MNCVRSSIFAADCGAASTLDAATRSSLSAERQRAKTLSPINVSGNEILAVRDLAAKLGARLGCEPIMTGREQPTAWLTDTSQAVRLFGPPIVDTERLIAWTADWVARAMPSLGKPTKYEVRDGRY